jgi:putative transposase
MPRIKRFVIEYGTYHILSRGHNKKQIFNEDEDFEFYLNNILSCKQEFQFKVYNYVMMDNHLHLIMYVPVIDELARIMRSLNQKYAQHYRKKYGGSGYVWQDRFKSFLIQEGRYLLECGRYVELNPVRAGIVKSPEEYKWSSYRFYALGEQNLILSFNDEYLGLSENQNLRMKKYIEFVNDGINDKRGLERYFRQGLYGSSEFMNKLKRMGLKETTWKRGRPKRKIETDLEGLL